MITQLRLDLQGHGKVVACSRHVFKRMAMTLIIDGEEILRNLIRSALGAAG
jgi:hypothetical protein